MENQLPLALSYFQVRPLLAARNAEDSVVVSSLDLGLTQWELRLEPMGVVLPDGQRLSWSQLGEVADTETVCFQVENNQIAKIQFFSSELNRFYSLMPTDRAPTMLVSGIPMHRIKGIDPHEDTLRKIRSVAPVIGRVLDTTTGLGYTAIEAARTAAEVVTIELDPTVLEVARCNPWSHELFSRPNIRQLLGDASERIRELEDRGFARIFHDPPTFRLAGELYSQEFYRELYRVLQAGGRLYHYIGDLDSTTGRVVAKGTARRLQEAGFRRVDRRPQTFGLVAFK
jgi:predicted methyltransferase